MYKKIIEDWEANRQALTSAAELNRGDVNKHLAAQAEGYAIACRLFDPYKKDDKGASKVLDKLQEAGATIRFTAKILIDREVELSTVADTLHNCHTNLNRVIPDDDDDCNNT